jgi:peptidoglycan/xylan/chitin deacetylase (PgdA/CDA1 family)
MLTRADQLALGFGAATVGAVGLFGFSALSLGVPMALLAAVLTDGIARPSSSVLYPTVTHGPRDRRRIALSFDDGPDPLVTPAVLDALKVHGARASFFVIGQALERQPDLARRMLAEGHELCNHSWRHSRWQNFWGPRAMRDEIARGEQVIGTFTDSISRSLYRSPIGLKSPSLARAAQQQGVRMIAWSLHSRDTRLCDPQQIAVRVLGRIKPGDIVLMHDGHDLPGRHRPACAAAVPLILAGLREKQLECVTVSELIGFDSLPLDGGE